MKLYELTYLLSPKLNEDEAVNFSEKISSFVQKSEGFPADNVSTKEKIVKRKLGSPVKEERQAYLGVLNFYFDPQKIEELKTELNSENQIIRYVILAKKLSAKTKISKPLLRVPKIEKKIKPPAEKVDLKEIEKKLDEILGE